MTMKHLWISALTAGMLTLGAVAQTSANGSAAGNASVNPGQTGANASASQSAQTPGASANVDSSANVKASQDQQSKKNEQKSASAGGNAAGTAASGANNSGAMLASGTTLQAELSKSVDAKKAKSGDEVTAKLTQDVKADGKVVLHKGSKLVGHVTEAQAKTKDNAESKLGIVFDKAMVKGGQEVAFSGVIQALAPPVQGMLSVAGDDGGNVGAGAGSGSGSAMGGGRSASPSPMGGAVGGATSTVNSVAGGATNAAGSVANSTTGAVNGTVNNGIGATAGGTLNSTSRGVVGLQGIALTPAAAGGAQGSVLSSANRNVKLDSGTQMVLQVTGSAPAAH
ncbi:MAG TPA: hypothetical protein VFT65_13530 [Candidatus Angelobacter sp.]|nr:hypothetical protein [Candidatus Angelobacter sp.]